MAQIKLFITDKSLLAFLVLFLVGLLFFSTLALPIQINSTGLIFNYAVAAPGGAGSGGSGGDASGGSSGSASGEGGDNRETSVFDTRTGMAAPASTLMGVDYNIVGPLAGYSVAPSNNNWGGGGGGNRGCVPGKICIRWGGRDNDQCKEWRIITCNTTNTTPSPVPGSCGTNATDHDLAVTTYPDSSFCSSGSPTPGNPAFPAINGEVPWTCSGSRGGAPANCKATRLAECFDEEDNDDDGFADFDGTSVFPPDASCLRDPFNDTETDPAQCDDGVDNDNDGTADFAGALGLLLDPSCLNDPNNDDEVFPKQCNDEVDNDGDLLKDYSVIDPFGPGSDLGCENLLDDDEIDPPSDLSINADPNLVRKGGSSTIDWVAKLVTECKVYKNGVLINSNDDIEPYTTFESSTNVSGITEETTFTLLCTAFDESVSSVSARVNILPIFEEF